MGKKAGSEWLEHLKKAAFLGRRKSVLLRETISTNDDARKLAEEGAVSGTVVIAERQLQGRGRMGRKWHSAPGRTLTLSYLLRPKVEQHCIPQLTLVAGLAVAKAITSCTGLQTAIKWPNDVLVADRKVAGLLCEFYGTRGAMRDPAVIIGIGVNVSMTEKDFSEEIQGKATSLLLEGAEDVSFPALIEEILLELEAQIQRHQKEGFAQILEEWRHKDATIGRRLAWVDLKGRVVEGVSLGPDEYGVLRIVDDAGITREVVSGDLSLAKEA